MATADPAARPSFRELQDRLMPRTVLGLSALILAFAIGAAFSGVVFYSYYEFRKDKSDEFVKNFEEQYKNAVGQIQNEREQAKAQIQEELEPLEKTRVEGAALQELAKKVEPSVWFVRTLDEAGAPSVGSAFVVASDSEQTLMITSFATVRAATRRPGPAIVLRKGDQEVRGELHTWHEERDLALLIVDRGDMPKLNFAPQDPPLRAGDRIFAVSGLGGANASVSLGFVADVSGTAIQHDAAVGQAYQGGPMINSDGELLAVASRAYAPLGFRSDDVWFAPPIRTACERVLRCPGDTPEGAGARR